MAVASLRFMTITFPAKQQTHFQKSSQSIGHVSRLLQKYVRRMKGVSVNGAGYHAPKRMYDIGLSLKKGVRKTTIVSAIKRFAKAHKLTYVKIK